MRKVLLLLLALAVVCPSVANAALREAYVYESDNFTDSPLATLTETQEGSNIYEGRFPDNVYTRNGTCFSTQRYNNESDFLQAKAAGELYLMTSAKGENFKGGYKYVMTISQSVNEYPGHIDFEYFTRDIRVNLNNKTAIYSTWYTIGISKEILEKVNLESDNDLLEQHCLYIDQILPGNSFDFVIIDSFLENEPVYEPVTDTAITLDSNGQFTANCISVNRKSENHHSFKVTGNDILYCNFVFSYYTPTKATPTFWAFNPDKTKCIYVDNDKSVRNIPYKVPTEAEGASRVQKLLPVAGAPGKFRGVVKPYTTGSNGVMMLRLFTKFASEDVTDGRDGLILNSAYQYPHPEVDPGVDVHDLAPSCSTTKFSPIRFTADTEESLEDYAAEVEVDLLNRRAVIIRFDADEVEYTPTTYNAIYLVGSMTSPTWNIDCTDRNYWLVETAPGIYERTIYVPQKEDGAEDVAFRFYSKPGEWGSANSLGGSWVDFSSVDAFVTDDAYTTMDLLKGGQGNWNLIGWEGGYINLRVDLNNDKIWMKKVYEPESTAPEFKLVEPERNSMFIHYAPLFGIGWENVEMTKLGKHEFTTTIEIPSGSNLIDLDADNRYITPPYPGYLVLRTDELTTDGKHLLSDHQFFYSNSYSGYYLTPTTWAGGEVKVDVNTLTHRITFTAEAAGIENVRADNADEALKGIYTISGVKLNCAHEDLPAGFYIIDGRKVMIR